MMMMMVYGCMLCLVRYLFVISTSVIDCLGRFIPEMTYCVSSGTLNLAQLNSAQLWGCTCLPRKSQRPFFSRRPQNTG